MRQTKQQLTDTLAMIGHAINCNDGKSYIVEKMLCEYSSLICKLLAYLDDEEKLASEHNHRHCGQLDVPLM